MPDRRNAPAPGTGRITWIVGALLRRDMRRWFASRGITFTEDKGLLDSQFVITTYSREARNALLAELTAYTRRVNAADPL